MNTLIVLNYNDADTTFKFILDIKNYKKLNHIVIVDNCSTDNSFQKLRILVDAKIVLIRTNANKGYAYGNNFGINYAVRHWEPKYIIISNPDVRFKETVLEKMETILNSKNDAAAVTCHMNCTSNIHLPLAWKLPNYTDCIIENLIILKKLFRFTTEYTEENLGKEVLEVEAIPGSFFMINTKKFLDVGGFDEGTFLYFEENILGTKFKNIGYKQYLLTKEEYLHAHSVSINKNIKSVSKRLKLFYLSQLYYCENYLKINRMQKIILKLTFELGRYSYLFAAKVLKDLIK